MKSISRCIPVILTSMIATNTALAEQDVQVVGKIQQPLERPVSNARNLLKAKTLPSSVTLLKIELSDNAWTKLENRLDTVESVPNPTLSISSKGTNVQLGMNNVPVLDQGPHGTCATFANTAAIDAALNKGDYISQLCLLELGNHLATYGYTSSGWDGSMGPYVLHKLQAFGFISKAKEHANGCGGLTDYPSQSATDPTSEMTLSEYHALSTPVNLDHVDWSSLVDVYRVFVDRVNPNSTLQQTKSALDAGDRLTFGVLLFSTNKGTVGAVGKHNVTNDSWVLSDDIIDDIKNQGDFGGHEMIITGYDDTAVAIDNAGKTHTGLLTLRNSWGPNIADQGNFYMSYDYFKALIIELQRIRTLR